MRLCSDNQQARMQGGLLQSSELSGRLVAIRTAAHGGEEGRVEDAIKMNLKALGGPMRPIASIHALQLSP